VTRTSIQPKKLFEIAADTVAFELGLPWRVDELREKAVEAYETAVERAEISGLAAKQADEAIRRRGTVYRTVMVAGRRMDRLPPGQSKPTPEQIETALEAFSTEQWIALIDGLDPSGTRALLSHIRQNSDELKQRPTARKIARIEVRAIMRDTDLWLAENRDKLVPISDVFWAVAFRNLAREANRTGKGHAAMGGRWPNRAATAA
jgi:hypothetical protein